MNAYAKSADTYLTQRILGASLEQQAALIMEAGQLHLGKAIRALTEQNLPSAINSFLRVSEVIMEATVRLDLENGGELAQNLKRLYDFWTAEIMIASKARDTARLTAVAHGMGEIRSAWEQLHEKKTGAGAIPRVRLGDRVV
jgi:flagellar protein FliS